MSEEFDLDKALDKAMETAPSGEITEEDKERYRKIRENICPECEGKLRKISGPAYVGGYRSVSRVYTNPKCDFEDKSSEPSGGAIY